MFYHWSCTSQAQRACFRVRVATRDGQPLPHDDTVSGEEWKAIIKDINQAKEADPDDPGYDEQNAKDSKQRSRKLYRKRKQEHKKEQQSKKQRLERGVADVKGGEGDAADGEEDEEDEADVEQGKGDGGFQQKEVEKGKEMAKRAEKGKEVARPQEKNMAAVQGIPIPVPQRSRG